MFLYKQTMAYISLLWAGTDKTRQWYKSYRKKSVWTDVKITAEQERLEVRFHALCAIAIESAEFSVPLVYLVMFVVMYHSPNAHNFGGIGSDE